MQKTFDIEWGIFSLVEFIVSSGGKIGNKYKTAIDIGSGEGKHAKILKAAGLQVFQLDKYSDTAEYKVDFIEYKFDRKFDIVFCSHVIEHQRNVGNFLDKIFDIMSDDGLLIICAPKHHAENLIEGHLNCFFTSYFSQHLIHSGFDLKEGKYLSCDQIENAAIVPKAKNFDLSERKEDGYNWTNKHQERCFFKLQNTVIRNELTFFYNCSVLHAVDGKINFLIPENYKRIGIEIDAKRWDLKVSI